MTEHLFAGEELTGEVLGVFYADRDSGFGVVELQPDAAAPEPEGTRCVGPLSDLVEGQTVRLVGAWKDHPRYGRTFEAVFYEQLAPQTEAGLAAFLHSERFRDVADRKDIQRILTCFGAATAEVIERDHHRLVAEAGVSRAVADGVHGRWVKGQVLSALVRIAQPARVPMDVVRAIHVRFGAAVLDVVREDPYALLAVDRCRFAHADALAMQAGIDRVDPRRLVAGARAALAAARRREGHQYLSRRQCIDAAARLLGVDVVAAADGLDRALARGDLAHERIEHDGAGVEAVYTPGGLASEAGLAEDLVRLLEADAPRLRPFADEVETSGDLTDGQAAAVRQVFASPVSLLTGGPGTGKTRTIEEVVKAAEGKGLNVALCAPTGRAAKRIEEIVGRPATTVHRLLDARPLPAGGFTFGFGADERLPHDLVICDEVSMCDTRLAGSLVAAVDDGAHLLLVGDADQLPSVGPGDVLADLVRAEVVPLVRLTEVHRQAAQSRIVSLAREVNDGAVGALGAIDGDVFMAEEARRDAIVPRVVEAVAARIPDYFGVGVDDVQVIAPVYRGPCGVDALNRALKQRLNPGAERSGLAGFDLGDRVMQTRNDAERDVSNGDIGAVVDIDRGARRLRVGFPRGEVTYDRDQTRDLTPAWAVTVHKSQGGEWPVVVLVVDRSHGSMLWRNLAYTAITRARSALVVVGQAEALRSAARHDVPRNRQTALAWRLAQLSGGGRG